MAKLFKPKNIAIAYRIQKPEVAKKAKEIATSLLKEKYKVFSLPDQDLGPSIRPFKESDLDKLDLMIVLGGDGTYLVAGKYLQDRPVPVLGINMGSLGFLTDNKLEDLDHTLRMTLQGKMELRTRAQLHIEVVRGGKKRSRHIALNDAVIERGSTTHLINIEIHNEKNLVGNIKADALIVASPTGSTAYNLAAGGPILHPEARCVVVTPVCPHALTNRPLIFPDDQELSFRNLSKDRSAVLTIDGVNCGELTPDDVVTVVRHNVDHVMLKQATHNFFKLLREKLKFGERE